MQNQLIIVLLLVSVQVFPQSEFDLTVQNDSATLSGTLLVPDSNPKKSVVLFFSGSGPNDRNGNTAPSYTSNSLKMLAQGLAENGIASLRFDKRGIGRSEFRGSEQDVRFDDFVNDGLAWLKLLKADDRFERIYVMGHSQGSLVGALVSRDEAVRKVISIAGISRVASDVIHAQLESQSPFMAKVAGPKLDSLKAGYPVSDPGPPLNAIFRKETQPFLISWFAYDPLEVFAELDKPVLIVNGTNDIQVSVAEAEKLREALPDSELLILEGMNHVLKDAPAERMANIEVYSDPEKKLSDGLMEGIVEFLND